MMAEVCLAYGYTPDEFRSLTLAEVKEFHWLLRTLKGDGK